MLVSVGDLREVEFTDLAILEADQEEGVQVGAKSHDSSSLDGEILAKIVSVSSKVVLPLKDLSAARKADYRPVTTQANIDYRSRVAVELFTRGVGIVTGFMAPYIDSSVRIASRELSPDRIEADRIHLKGLIHISWVCKSVCHHGARGNIHLVDVSGAEPGPLGADFISRCVLRPKDPGTSSWVRHPIRSQSIATGC